VLPNLKLNPGSNIIIPLQINSTERIKEYATIFKEPIIIYLKSIPNPRPIKYSFNPDKLIVPPTGAAMTNLSISVPKNIPIGNFTLPVTEVFTSGYDPHPTRYGTLYYRIPVQTVHEGVLEWVRNFLIKNGELAALMPLMATSIFMFAYFSKLTRTRYFVTLKIGNHKVEGLDENSVISHKDLLQVNGAIIAGVLILLTIQTTQSAIIGIHRSSVVVGIITASIVVPFAYSAFIIVRYHDSNKLLHSIFSTIAGFIYLIVAIILLAIIR
jgi:hypothetical protein